MSLDTLPIVEGCWVTPRHNGNGLSGHVLSTFIESNRTLLRVNWIGGEAGSAPATLAANDVRSGFKVGMEVEDIPYSNIRSSMGVGAVKAVRTICGQDQCLVQLHVSGESLWLPFERLKRVKPVSQRYVKAEAGDDRAAERYRLKLLAYALENWNQTTGTLDRLDVDPLPHQIHIVHRILSSGNTNWLIADDVGLGKTIEVGLLIAALKRRRQARRVLVVCPAGLLVQWQEDMQFKFGQRYQIYARDFMINDPIDWKLYDHVIISLDLAKREDTKALLRASGEWDLIVFDEAHRLTRQVTGEQTQRYALARHLRSMTDSFILLTATPHQGVHEKFVSILELVRPDLKRELQQLDLNPEVIRDVILRNRKSQVTDAAGKAIFKGIQITRCAVPMSAPIEHFGDMLQEYLEQGYGAERRGGARERAIGFVMTTYRKLASSSVAAIKKALAARLERLRGSPAASEREIWSIDGLEFGDDTEHEVTPTELAGEFFIDEIAMLERLVNEANKVYRDDEKIRFLINDILRKALSETGHVLIFTEYRATQEYLRQKISEAFPDMPSPVLIHGSMSLDEKIASMKAFREEIPVLISTEAGGEGLNLHHSCHVMVNYDLPWNPSKLVQRMGRLYRYGQNKVVLVFNMHGRDTFDNQAIDLMMHKIDAIARDMAPVGEDYHEQMYQDILGDLLEQIDFEELLERMRDMEIQHAEQSIVDAVEKARQAMELQDDILAYADHYTSESLSGTLGLNNSHVHVLLRDALPLCGFANVHQSKDGKTISFTLPEELVGRYVEFGKKQNILVTADRQYAQEHRDANMMDFESQFFTDFISMVRSQSFDGLYASVDQPLDGMLSCYHVRWQNDQGKITGQDFMLLSGDDKDNLHINPIGAIEALIQPWQDVQLPGDIQSDVRQARIQMHGSMIEEKVKEQISVFKQPNGIVLLQACDTRKDAA